MITCKWCNKELVFDDWYVSERTGKKIPLDWDTEEPHDCEMKPRYRKHRECNKGCGREIYFDDDQRTVNGKWIPIDRETDAPHNCPIGGEYDDENEEERVE